MSDRPDLVQPHPIDILDRLDMLSWDLARTAAARIRELEAQVEMTKPVWMNERDPVTNLRRWRRSDGATVTLVVTKTGKRPWRGSHWHRGEWKLNARTSNAATAEAAMAGIDRHWPKAMTPYPVKDKTI